jgi:hypothetical protein
MGENMRPSGSTPPSSLYPQVFPSNNLTTNMDPHHHHHQYGAFASNFTDQMAAAVACSSSGYPTFFPSKFSLIAFYTLAFSI